MVDAHFRALGAGLFEAAVAWFAPDWRLRRRGEIVGLEHLDAAQSDGSGVLLLTGHFTTLEVVARYVAMAPSPFPAIYRPYSHAVLNYFMTHCRYDRYCTPTFTRTHLDR